MTGRYGSDPNYVGVECTDWGVLIWDDGNYKCYTINQTINITRLVNIRVNGNYEAKLCQDTDGKNPFNTMTKSSTVIPEYSKVKSIIISGSPPTPPVGPTPSVGPTPIKDHESKPQTVQLSMQTILIIVGSSIGGIIIFSIIIWYTMFRGNKKSKSPISNVLNSSEEIDGGYTRIRF